MVSFPTPQVVESNPNTPAPKGGAPVDTAAAPEHIDVEQQVAQQVASSTDTATDTAVPPPRPVSRARSTTRSSNSSSRVPTPILKKRGDGGGEREVAREKSVRFDAATGQRGGDWALQSLLHVASKWLDKAAKATGSSSDACVIKLYEFLVPSIWHYIVQVRVKVINRRAERALRDLEAQRCISRIAF